MWTEFEDFMADYNKESSYLRDKDAVFNACESGDFDYVVSAINNGFNINDTRNSVTLLMSASVYGRKDIVNFLLDTPTSNDIINYQELNNDTALHFAVYSGCCESVALLINKGIDVNIINDKGVTAYDEAYENKDFISMFLCKKQPINHKDNDGNTITMLACHAKDEKGILYLYDNGADFNIKNDKGDSALKILKRKRGLSDNLKALKEKLILESMTQIDDCQSPGL